MSLKNVYISYVNILVTFQNGLPKKTPISSILSFVSEPICRTISTFLDENALGDVQSDEMFSDSISDSDQEFIEMGVMLATELDSLGISRASSAMSSVSPTDWDSKQLESMGSG